MDNKDLTAKTAALITTLAEFPEGASESICYLALDFSDTQEWYGLKGQLLKAGLIRDDYNLLTLTPKGLELAKKLEAALAKKGGA